MDCEPIGLPGWCTVHRQAWKDCKKMELNAERDSGLVLKPGMRVKVEIEGTVEPGVGGVVRVAGVAFSRNGERTFLYPGSTAKVAILPVSHEVTVKLTGPGLTPEQAEKLVRQFIETSDSIRDGDDGLTFDIKPHVREGVVHSDGRITWS